MAGAELSGVDGYKRGTGAGGESPGRYVHGVNRYPQAAEQDLFYGGSMRLRVDRSSLVLSDDTIPVGFFTVTAYNSEERSTGKSQEDPGYGITATGKPAIDGVTVAADWQVLPPGTVIYIQGIGERVVEDKGAAIVGNALDLYMEEGDAELFEFGVKCRLVYVIKWGGQDNGQPSIHN